MPKILQIFYAKGPCIKESTELNLTHFWQPQDTMVTRGLKIKIISTNSIFFEICCRYNLSIVVFPFSWINIESFFFVRIKYSIRIVSILHLYESLLKGSCSCFWIFKWKQPFESRLTVCKCNFYMPCTCEKPKTSLK